LKEGQTDPEDWANTLDLLVPLDANYTVTAVYVTTPPPIGPLFSDSFDDDSRSSFWYSVSRDAAMSSMVEVSGHLQFIATNVTTGPIEPSCLMRMHRLDPRTDFKYQVDWRFSSGSSPDTAIFLAVARDRTHFARVKAGYNAAGAAIFGGESDKSLGLNSTTNRSAVTGTFYVSYQAATDTLYLSVNGYNRTSSPGLGDYTISNAMATWNPWVPGIHQSTELWLVVGGYSNGSTVASGQAYFNNFQIPTGRFLRPPTTVLHVDSRQSHGQRRTGRRADGPYADV
jgi:hypothetical protein